MVADYPKGQEQADGDPSCPGFSLGLFVALRIPDKVDHPWWPLADTIFICSRRQIIGSEIAVGK